MKGKVLGLEADGGVISGEDGGRYRFANEQWKNERRAQPGDEVDFETADGRAVDIFVLRSAGGISTEALGANLERVRNSASGGRALEIARTQPSAVIAAVVLFASVLLNYVAVGGDGITLLALNFALDDLRGGLGMLGGVIDTSGLELVIMLAWPLVVVPFLAGYILFLAWKDVRRRRYEVILYALCAYAWIYQAAVNALIQSAMEDTLFGRMASGTTVLPLGIGGWIISAASLVGFWFLFRSERTAETA